MRRLLAFLILLITVVVAVIYFSASSSNSSPTLSGQVRHAGVPVSNALVRLKGTTNTVRSDDLGRFRLTPTTSPTARRVTAWKPGYFITGSPFDADPLRLTLHPLPASDNRDYLWVDPDPDPRGEHNCANCHREIHREWNESGHARSATGRHFRDLYLGTGGGWSLRDQHPDGSGVCTACHAPTVLSGDPALFDLGKVQGVAAKGVHCDYCHKITGLTDGTIGLAHGRDILTLLRPKEGQLFLGPLDDVDRGEDTYSPFYRDSRYCASCHEGVVFGVHVYSTYSEWLDSPARKLDRHCQDCHMKPTGTMTNIAPGKGGIERDPRTLGNHRFFAGSREAMLKEALKLNVELSRANGELQTVVSLRAEGVGHRVPTGFIDRHLILSVEALDAKGTLVALLEGPRLPSPAGKELTGRPGKLFAKLLKDAEGHRPAPFWKADLDPEDTRLYPGRVERLAFRFPAEAKAIRVRLLHRRFWEEVTRTKGWPDTDIVIVDRSVREQPLP